MSPETVIQPSPRLAHLQKTELRYLRNRVESDAIYSLIMRMTLKASP